MQLCTVYLWSDDFLTFFHTYMCIITPKNNQLFLLFMCIKHTPLTPAMTIFRLYLYTSIFSYPQGFLFFCFSVLPQNIFVVVLKTYLSTFKPPSHFPLLLDFESHTFSFFSLKISSTSPPLHRFFLLCHWQYPPCGGFVNPRYLLWCKLLHLFTCGSS